MKRPQYPEPAVPYEGYSPIRFGMEWRVRSKFNLAGSDDRGILELSSRRVLFSGQRYVVDCTDVVGIALVRSDVPWPLGILIFVVSALVVYRTGGPFGMTVKNPLMILLLAAIAANATAASSYRWIRVEYLDADGVTHRANFRDDRAISGQPRGTERLFGEMRSKVLRSDG